MSHYAEIKVDALVRNEADLVGALSEVFGAAGVQVLKEARILEGMDRQSHRKAHVIVTQAALRKHSSPGYNELGFERKSDGTYSMHVDGMDLRPNVRDAIFQDYSQRVTERKLKANGYAIKRVKLDNGDIELTATKS
jgi:hypothetical protein